jgi:hypothetical protein
VWQNQLAALPLPARPIQAPPAVVENVDIERPRLHGWCCSAARAAFDLLDQSQQISGSNAAGRQKHSIEICRLASASQSFSFI